MDRIKQYQDLCEIRPDYHKLVMPMQKLSIKRVKFNQKELELHYNQRLKVYMPESALDENENNKSNKSKVQNKKSHAALKKKGGLEADAKKDEEQKIDIVTIEL